MVENLKIDEIDLSSVNLVDIRTVGEWESGVIDCAIKVCFVDENGNYDIDNFIDILKSKIDINKKIALICESGNRSLYLANLLSQKNIDTINVVGGMKYARVCNFVKIV